MGSQLNTKHSLDFTNTIIVDSLALFIGIDNFFTHPNLKTWVYPGGEIGVQYLPFTNVAKYTISTRIRDTASLIALYQLIKIISISLGTADNISLFIPYLPYSRQDRTQITKEGWYMPDMNSFIVDLLSSFPVTITTFDIHSLHPKINNIEPTYQANKLVELLNPGLILFPDKGAFNRYSKLFYCVPCKAATKTRDPGTGKLELDIPKDCFKAAKNNTILVFDDICDGGGTFELLGEKVPSNFDLYLYVSHGIFSKPILNLKKYYSGIYSTTSFSSTMPEGVRILR